jgi:hypothetical protein
MLFGRAYPIKAHLPKPIIGAPVSGPVVTRAQIFSQRTASIWYQRLKPHLAGPIVTTVLPPIVTRAQIVSPLKLNPVKTKPRVRLPVFPVPPGKPIVTNPYIIRAFKETGERVRRSLLLRVKHGGPIIGPPVVIVYQAGIAVAAQATCSGAIASMAVSSGAIAAQACVKGGAVKGQSY